MGRVSKGSLTASALKNLQHLFMIRKMRLDIDSVDPPIANYYIYLLMKENKTMDEGSWYTKYPSDGGKISYGMIELALTILSKAAVKKPIDKYELAAALERSELLGDGGVIDLRFIYMKTLLEVVETYRKLIYEEKK